MSKMVKLSDILKESDDDLMCVNLNGLYAKNTEVVGVSTDELEKGIEIEMEHTEDPEVARRIAMDHLMEIPDYYTRLIKMEKEAEEHLLPEEFCESLIYKSSLVGFVEERGEPKDPRALEKEFKRGLNRWNRKAVPTLKNEDEEGMISSIGSTIWSGIKAPFEILADLVGAIPFKGALVDIKLAFSYMNEFKEILANIQKKEQELTSKASKQIEGSSGSTLEESDEIDPKLQKEITNLYVDAAFAAFYSLCNFSASIPEPISDVITKSGKWVSKIVGNRLFGNLIRRSMVKEVVKKIDPLVKLIDKQLSGMTNKKKDMDKDEVEQIKQYSEDFLPMILEFFEHLKQNLGLNEESNELDILDEGVMENQAKAMYDKAVRNNPDRGVASFEEIKKQLDTQKTNHKHLPRLISYYFYDDVDLNILKDYYSRFINNNKINKKDINQFKTFQDFEQLVDSSVVAAGKQDLKQVEDKPIFENEEFRVFLADSKEKAQKYGQGAKYNFCISRFDGGNLYHGYRSRGATFYFVYMNESMIERINAPAELLVIHAYPDGKYQINYAKPNSDEDIKVPELLRILDIDEKTFSQVFKNEPLTPEEKRIYEEINSKISILNLKNINDRLMFIELGKEIRSNQWNKLGNQLETLLHKYIEVGNYDVPDNVVDKYPKLKKRYIQKLKQRLEIKVENNYHRYTPHEKRIAPKLGYIYIGKFVKSDSKDYKQYLTNMDKIFEELKSRVRTDESGNKYIDGTIAFKDYSINKFPDWMKDVRVGGYFNCSINQLTSLEGAPREVVGSFDCSRNQLTSLEGAPRVVGGEFNCSINQLTSLEGAPREVGGRFYCSDNPVAFTDKDIKEAMEKSRRRSNLTEESVEGLISSADSNFLVSFHINKSKNEEEFTNLSISIAKANGEIVEQVRLINKDLAEEYKEKAVDEEVMLTTLKDTIDKYKSPILISDSINLDTINKKLQENNEVKITDFEKQVNIQKFLKFFVIAMKNAIRDESERSRFLDVIKPLKPSIDNISKDNLIKVRDGLLNLHKMKRVMKSHSFEEVMLEIYLMLTKWLKEIKHTIDYSKFGKYFSEEISKESVIFDNDEKEEFCKKPKEDEIFDKDEKDSDLSKKEQDVEDIFKLSPELSYEEYVDTLNNMMSELISFETTSTGDYNNRMGSKTKAPLTRRVNKTRSGQKIDKGGRRRKIGVMEHARRSRKASGKKQTPMDKAKKRRSANMNMNAAKKKGL